MEETLGTYTDLIREGKVRAIGASNFTADRLAKSLDISKAQGYACYETLQPAYNLYDRRIEKDLQPLCEKEDIGIISSYALASGFLTGKYRLRKPICIRVCVARALPNISMLKGRVFWRAR
jgi:aryl-alcohol dehydrogenase-like predicted oxidoreductase